LWNVILFILNPFYCALLSVR